MTNRKYVYFGNLGELFAWQLVLFPIIFFLIAKCRRAFSRRNDEYRRWRLLDVIIAEIASYLTLIAVAATVTFIFDKEKVMYDAEPCTSSDECRRGPLRVSTEERVSVTKNDFVTLYRMKGNFSGQLRRLNITVFYTHGNSGNVGAHIPNVTYKNLLHMGLNVITWDPPGFGLSTGSPSYAGWMAAAEIVLSRVLKGNPDVILYGRSLGGAVTTLLASKRSFRGVILEAPLDSMAKLFSDFFRLTAYVMGPIWTDAFDAYRAISEVDSCLFHYAAEEDDLITDYRQKRLNEQAQNKISNCSYFIVGKGKLHNDVSWNNLHYGETLKEFFKKTLATR